MIKYHDREWLIVEVEYKLRGSDGKIHSEHEREFFRRELGMLTRKELQQIMNQDGSLNRIAWYVYNNLRQNYHAEISDDPTYRTINPIVTVLKRDRLFHSIQLM